MQFFAALIANVPHNLHLQVGRSLTFLYQCDRQAERLESWQDTQITEEMSEDVGKRSPSPTLESL